MFRIAQPYKGWAVAIGNYGVWHVVRDGDLRASLTALRDRLAEQIDAGENRCLECNASDGRVLATLTKELREVLTRIDQLPDSGEVSRIDELASARQARQASGRRKAKPAERPAVSE